MIVKPKEEDMMRQAFIVGAAAMRVCHRYGSGAVCQNKSYTIALQWLGGQRITPADDPGGGGCGQHLSG